MLEIGLFLHHNPNLRQSKTKYVFTANYCPICESSNPTKGNFFRVNTKLGVFKCYHCGEGGKTVKKFIKLIKESKIKILAALIREGEFEIYKCETFQESELPF